MKKPSKEQLLQDILSDLTWSEIASKYNYSDSKFLRRLAIRYDLPPRRKILKPTKNQLEQMIFVDKLTIKDIANKLGYAPSGWSLIYSYCREYGIKFDFKPNHELRNTTLTQYQLSFIYGTLLGDGSLVKSGNNYVLKLTHGEKQIEYLKWKYSIVKYITTTERFYKRISNFKGNLPTYSFSTVSHKTLTEIRKTFYPNDVKTITKEVLSKIDDFSLAVWYMDDGSINKRYKTIVLCTNCFSYEEHKLISDWFLEKYSIPIVIEKRRNNQFVIRVNASNSQKFLNIVKPYIPKCMSYKLG